MKKAFSLVEIGIMLLVVTSVFFAVVPFSVSNIKQAKFIADWKEYTNQVQYSFETLKEYKKNHAIDNKASVKRLMEYLDGRNISSNSKEVKNYRYKMMNGKFYQKMNIKKFDEVYIDERNRLIGIEYNKSENGKVFCSEKTPCATVWVDINGKTRPNTVGNDIFIFEIYPNSAEAFGKGISFESLKKDCSHDGTGMFCSKFYLLGGDLQ